RRASVCCALSCAPVELHVTIPPHEAARECCSQTERSSSWRLLVARPPTQNIATGEGVGAIERNNEEETRENTNNALEGACSLGGDLPLRGLCPAARRAGKPPRLHNRLCPRSSHSRTPG